MTIFNMLKFKVYTVRTARQRTNERTNEHKRKDKVRTKWQMIMQIDEQKIIYKRKGNTHTQTKANDNDFYRGLFFQTYQATTVYRH